MILLDTFILMIIVKVSKYRRAAAVLLAAVVGLAVGSGPARAEEAARPNVLLIYADQHRFDCLGAMGHPDVKTPHLDALARDGVLFRNSFCTWPVCTPSRYSILSGLYVRQHRNGSNRDTLLPGTPTFAGRLREAGYRTKAVGKMHFTPAYLDVGFDEMELAEQNGRGRFVDDYHRYLQERGLVDTTDLIDQEQPYRERAPKSYWETFGAGRSNLPEEHHSTTWIGNRSVETLTRWKSGEPGLLMVGFIKPHHPFDPPAPWDAMYDPEKLTVLPGWLDALLPRDADHNRGYFDNRTLTPPALRRVMAHYYGAISQIDAQVGRMVEVLKQAGLYDNTLIVYTADHGEFMGFHHLLLKNNHLYDPLVKVPLIVKFPKGRHGGAVSDALASSIDVTATILREGGLKPGPDMRGRPLGPAAAGESAGREHVIVEDGRSHMIRSRTRKLIWSTRPGGTLFFDLEKDPLEIKSRYDDPACQKEIQAMKDALLAWFQAEAVTSSTVDLGAPEIGQPNVPKDRAAAEREMEAYVRRKMEEALGEGK